MPGFLASLILLSTALMPIAAKADAMPLDMTAIRQVNITGESSRVNFTTLDTVPYMANITGTRTNWLAAGTQVGFQTVATQKRQRKSEIRL